MPSCFLSSFYAFFSYDFHFSECSALYFSNVASEEEYEAMTDSSDSASATHIRPGSCQANGERDGSRRGRLPGRGRRPGKKPLRSDSQDGWTEKDSSPRVNTFTGANGVNPETHLDQHCSPLDFFAHFIDKDLVNLMKEQTNLYARQRIRHKRNFNQISPKSRLANWKTVSQGEIKKFLSIIIHMSVSERSDMKDHWGTSPVVSCNFCPNVMSRDRFLSLLANFHLSDNLLMKKKGEPGYDPLHKVRPLLEMLREKCKSSYQVAEDITIDEGMCAYRGRLYFKQYMPQKPSRYGIKLYILSESKTGYVWNFDIFCGQANAITEVVMNLLDSLAGKGHTLFTDRYYTSPTLAAKLENVQTALVGTVQKNRIGMPRALRNPILQKGEQIFRRKGNVLVLCWKDKREVYMLSTKHKATMVTYNDRRGREKTKPAAVLSYNAKKFGVDLADQRMSYGVFNHRSIKWWRKLAFHMILMCLTNACIMYNQVKPKKLSVVDFMKQIASDLAVFEEDPCENPTRSGVSLSRLTGRHFLEKIPVPEGRKKKQLKCRVCAERGKSKTGTVTRKDTTWRCSVCKLAMCIEPCFALYHSKKNYVTIM